MDDTDGDPGEAGADGPQGTGTRPEDVPEWDDEYLSRVSDRLLANYDLERDRRVRGERFALYGRLHLERHKQFLHPSVRFGRHYTEEHLFARRVDRTSEADLRALVETGHALADDWIDADEEHQSTEFTFVAVVPEVPDAVASFVEGFRDRTLLKAGYNGHYEVNIVAVAPDRERIAASRSADVARAFALWEDPSGAESSGLLARLTAPLRR